ncbi:MAG: hypothetical protein IKJ16_06150 [Agathobacter sp.]|nr:hypothetical protein [Agathobacter sp.]
MAHVLHNACSVEGVKVNVMSAIDIMVHRSTKLFKKPRFLIFSEQKMLIGTYREKNTMKYPVFSILRGISWCFFLYMSQGGFLNGFF